MKTAFITALALGTVAFAGEKSAPVAIAPAPAAPVHTWAVELGAQYNWGLGKFMKNSVVNKKNHINTVGGDITGVYNLDENQAVTLRFGYTYGSDKFAFSGGSEGCIVLPNGHIKERLHTFSLMPGYRYTYAINDKWSVYAGANIGVSAEKAYMKETVNLDRRSSISGAAHKSAWGFAYSVEVGAKYAINENWGAFAALSFSGNTAKPNLKYDGYSVGKVRAQQYLGVRAGVSYSF